MHGTFNYEIEGQAGRHAGPSPSSAELAQFGRWAGVVLMTVLGLMIGAFAGLVTGVLTGLIGLC